MNNSHSDHHNQNPRTRGYQYLSGVATALQVLAPNGSHTTIERGKLQPYHLLGLTFEGDRLHSRMKIVRRSDRADLIPSVVPIGVLFTGSVAQFILTDEEGVEYEGEVYWYYRTEGEYRAVLDSLRLSTQPQHSDPQD